MGIIQWFKNLFSPEPVIQFQTLTVIPEVPDVHDLVVSYGPRNGMWVRTPEGRIGIVLHSYPSGLVDVVRTKGDGSNVMTLTADDQATVLIETYDGNYLAQARISEIPTSRYESVEQLKALGYGED